jgi:hypothetical protein
MEKQSALAAPFWPPQSIRCAIGQPRNTFDLPMAQVYQGGGFDEPWGSWPKSIGSSATTQGRSSVVFVKVTDEQ